MTLTDITFKDYTANAFKQYYTTFLSYAINHPEWGVLIKPKKYRIWEDIDENIKILVDELYSQRRLVITETKQSPMVAAYASDICIGLLISSAATIAACRGGLSVCWDISGTPGHPLYNSKKSVIIYQNLSDIINILDNFSSTFRSKLIEDRHFSILNKIDPFRDGRGPNRIGKFIQDYMDYINYNLNHNEALVKACDNYQADNGEGCVINAFNGTNNNIRTKNLWTDIPLIEEQKVVFYK